MYLTAAARFLLKIWVSPSADAVKYVKFVLCRPINYRYLPL